MPTTNNSYTNEEQKLMDRIIHLSKKCKSLEAKACKDSIFIKVYGEEISKLKKELKESQTQLAKYQETKKSKAQDFGKFLREINNAEMEQMGVSEQDLESYVNEARMAIEKL